MSGRRQRTRYIVPATIHGSLRIRDNNLVTELPVVLLELSGDGCLVESLAEVPASIEGELHLKIDGRLCRDEVRIVRCLADGGATRAYRIAAQFIPRVSADDSVFPVINNS